ncbi:MAG: FAD-dependent oxidoreductase [Bifidobacteriales bacterium]|nr:FAD-dependent oxidoreductase [Bifidobacteriales bacterium]
MTNNSPLPCDVLIIGGGPAGSTAAITLARQGLDVVIIEKEQHPRFHIGESLLACNIPILKELGVLDDVAAIGVYKPGAEFVTDTGEGRMSFPFRYAIDAQADHAFQVRRAEFDEILFRHAAKAGATTLEKTRVTKVSFTPTATLLIEARTETGEMRLFAPRFLLDASGRDTLMLRQHGQKYSDLRNNKAAIFSHFRNVPRAEGEGMEGYISVHLVQGGWFWMIPLPDDVMSVGFVGDHESFKHHGGSLDALFWKHVQASPSVQARMAKAEALAPLSTTGNYSYKGDKAWGERYFIIGDAFGFLDPVFSSGVMLAMKGALRGAHVASQWLLSPQWGRKAARKAERQTRQEMQLISWLVYRINDPLLRYFFMRPKNKPLRMRDAIIALLAGNFAPSWRVMIPFRAFTVIFGLAKRFKHSSGL